MEIYVGIDVGKYTLDVFCNNQRYTVNNTQAAIKSLLKSLKKTLSTGQKIALVAFEATGGYEKILKKTLVEQNYPYRMAHPNRVRAFAKSKGLLAKTDKLDAKLISQYAQTMQLQPEQIVQENTMLGELLKRRETLLADKTRETNRLDKGFIPETQRSIRKHIKWLEKEIKAIDEKIVEESKQGESSEQVALLSSVPGVGRLSACYLSACLPELGNLSHAAISALVGVAPFNRDSGQYSGKRFIQGGRPRLRRILYMTAVVSIRCNPSQKAFYERLTAQGKPAKVALVAVMRKILTTLNSIAKRQTPWVDKYEKNLCIAQTAKNLALSC